MIIDPMFCLYTFVLTVLFLFANMFILNYIDLKISSRIERRLGMINEFVFLRNIVFKFLRDIGKLNNNRGAHFSHLYYIFPPLILLVNIIQLFFIRSVLQNNDINILYFLMFNLLVIILLILNSISTNQKDKVYANLMNLILKLIYLIPITLTFLYSFKTLKSFNINIFITKQIHQWLIFKDPVGFLICFISILVLTGNIRVQIPSIKEIIHEEGYFSDLSMALSKFIICSIVVFIFFGGAKDIAVKMITIPSEIVLIFKTYFIMFLLILVKNSLPVFSFRQIFDFLFKILIPITILNYFLRIVLS